jgi:hypothetical protein
MQNNDQGWIKIHRVLLDKPIWQSSTAGKKTILFALLIIANDEGDSDSGRVKILKLTWGSVH